MGPSIFRSALVALILLASTVFPHRAYAQELEPRMYAPAPSNINFIGVAYGRSEGELLFDPSIPIKNVYATIDSVAIVYGKGFAIANRAASVAIVLPYVTGDITGDVMEQAREIHRAGLSDLHLRFGLNFLRAPAFMPGDTRRSAPTSVGASFHIVAPTGKYDPKYAVNIGNNRWAFKTEVGISHPIGRWVLDATAGLWMFTANDDFYNGKHREQDPLANVQGHVSYVFGRGIWLAGSMTYFAGGQTRVDGDDVDDRKSNTRVGATLTVPTGRGHAIKIAWSSGARVRFGGDFDTYGIAWQYAWLN